jgi:hypothetical protein
VALRSSGHDVRQIAGTPEAGLEDDAIWRLAQAEGRLVLTSDRAFARRRNEPHFGMIVVRLRQPNREDFRRRTLDAVCEAPSDEWPGLLVVVRDRAQTLYRAKPSSR